MAAPFAALVNILRCPACRAPLDYRPAPQPSGGEYGVLRCPCAAYPVVDGVPILLEHDVPIRSIADARRVDDGPRVDRLVALVEAGDGREALVDLLSVPICPWPLNRLGAARALSLRTPVRGATLAARRRRIRRMLDCADALTAEDWMAALYLHAPIPFDPFTYFFFRFGQPRHLAALALLPILTEAALRGPVLDLACGYGHGLHALAAHGVPDAIGLDQNLHQLWVARTFIAPGAHVVCADARRPLPFADAALSGVVCADAFHYIEAPEPLVAEIQRCAPEGPFVIARTGNRLVGPQEGYERSPEEYAALLAPWRVAVVGEGALLDGYLDHRWADLSDAEAPSRTEADAWLSFVSTPDGGLFRDHGQFESWPHAAGPLRLNPVYACRPSGTGLDLSFRWPSPWYAHENRGMETYHAATAHIDANTLRALPLGVHDEAGGALADRFLALGLPERYARPTGRPLAARAMRHLTPLLS